jgi:hypothetical protein
MCLCVKKMPKTPSTTEGSKKTPIFFDYQYIKRVFLLKTHTLKSPVPCLKILL